MSDASPPPAAPPREPSSLRLVLTLAVSGVLAGLLLSFAYHATQPAIAANRAAREREAAAEVLGSPARVEILYLVDGTLTPDLPAGSAASSFEKAFRGLDAQGKVLGWALRGSSPGYADAVAVMFGYDPATGSLLGMRVLECKETPGLGDAVQKSAAFTDQFAGREPPLEALRKGKRTGAKNEVDAITGATISSRAVVRAINAAVDRWAPLLRAAGAQRGAR